MAPSLLAEEPCEQRAWTARVIEFVRDIGLEVEACPQASGFLPHVRIVRGGLHVVPAQVFPGDILHEAGHLAVIPSRFRPLAQDDLEGVFEAMGRHLQDNPDGLGCWPEDTLCRAILQSGEAEATAWQYAAARHIGLPDALLFPPGSFDGGAEDVLGALTQGRHLGINGLRAAHWTRTSLRAPGALPVYPELAFWLHPG